MVAIRNISFRGTKRGRGSAGVWLGAALVMAAVAAGASLAQVTGGSDPSLQAALAPTPTSTAAPVTVGVEPDAAQPVTAEEARPRPGAEEQRRMFMLLLLNSAGPLRPYSGLSH